MSDKISIKKLLTNHFGREFLLGFRLSWQYITRGRKWTLFLTVFLMAVAFINLIFISSLLNGIVTETKKQVVDNLSGEIYLKPTRDFDQIQNLTKLRQIIKTDSNITNFSEQFNFFAKLTHNGNKMQGQIRVIDVGAEKNATSINQHMVEGDYFENKKGIVIGYQVSASGKSKEVSNNLEGAKIGDEIEINYNGKKTKLPIIGVFRTKYLEADSMVFMPRQIWQTWLSDIKQDFANDKQKIIDNSKLPTDVDRFLPNQVKTKIDDKLSEQKTQLLDASQELEDLFPAKDDINHIIIRTDNPSQTIDSLQQKLDNRVEIHSWNDAAGFMTSIADSFIGIDAIMLVVGIIIAAVTIFIVIYVDIVNKRRQIGIQRAIGVKPRIIVFSYVILAAFYAFCGIAVGLMTYYLVLVPYFQIHPFSLPVADVSLNLEWTQLILRINIVFVVSIISGLIPSILAARAKMLDAILGRN